MSAVQNTDINLAEIHSHLQTLLQILQTKHILLSIKQQTPPSTPSFYTFFLTPLPLLLTSQKERAIYKLRNAYIYVTHLSSFAEQPVKERYINFGRALLWALDHADDLLRRLPDVGELEVMKAVKTIFHLVTSLCYREWDIDQSSVHHPHHVIDASPNNTVPSVQDPAYHPPSRVTSNSAGNPSIIGDIIGDVSEQAKHVLQVGTNLHHGDHTIFPNPLHNTIDDELPIPAIQPFSMGSRSNQLIEMEQFTNSVQNNDTSHENDHDKHSPPLSNYIRNNGKHILPDACMKETADGCHVPFDLFVQDNREDDIFGIFGYLTCNVGVSYPDNTCFSQIPVHDIRLLKHLGRNGYTEQDGFNTLASVEMGTKVYETLINRLKEAYITKFPDRLPIFLPDSSFQHPINDKSVEIKLPVLSDCFVRVLHLLWFVEYPVRDALEMCQHDVCGYGLLQAELVEGPNGIRIVISLVGIVVERNLLNYGERIFELLDRGAVSDL